MRHFVIYVGLVLCATWATAFEIEARHEYPGSGGGGTLRILSTADIEVFAPLIVAFQSENPSLDIVYDVASSAQIMQAIALESAAYDLAISSAMDLQMKLANDGMAQPH